MAKLLSDKLYKFGVFRLVIYILSVIGLIAGLGCLLKNSGIIAFYENKLVENIQIILLFIGVISFSWQAKKSLELRPVLLLFASICLLAICRELDTVFAEFLPNIPWKFGFVFFIVGLIYSYFKREFFWSAVKSFCKLPILLLLGIAIIVLLPLAELFEHGWFNLKADLAVVYEEIAEVIGYFLIFFTSLEIHFNKAQILDKIYEKFGEKKELKVLSEKQDKVVYNISTNKDDFITIVIPHITATRFYKYMSSQGLQQELFKDGMGAVEIPYAYIEGDNVVSVHRRFIGSDNFADEKEFLAVSGRTYGKLHRITMNPKYKKTFMLLNYPNILVRAYMFVRYVLNRQLSQYIKYYKLRKFPWGICHRDNNGKNVLIDEKGNTVLLDFDKHRYMPLVEGLIYFYRKHLKDKSLFNIFLKAYEEERPLTKEEREYLNKTLNIKV